MSRKLLARGKKKIESELPLNRQLRSPQQVVLPPEEVRQRQRLYPFLLGAWQQLQPNREFSPNWHLEYLAEYLELVKSGEIKKLLINIQPRSLKSFLSSVCFPCWWWIDAPHLRFLCLSYASRLANDHSQLRRDLIKTDWYRRIGNNLTLKGDKDRISEFANHCRGEQLARGFDSSGVTGAGGDVLLIDDPNDPIKVESDAIRSETTRKFKDYSVGRRNDPKNTPVIVIQQRTHQNDVSGFILKELADEYVKIVIPTRSPIRVEIRSPKDGRLLKTREPGELMHPERFGEKEDAEALKTLGAYLYASRHQQDPVALTGQLLDLQQFRRYRHLPHRFELVVQTWDTASKAGDNNNPWSCLTIGVFEDEFYILDALIKRMEFPEGKRNAFNLALRDEPDYILIEDKSTGQSLIQEFQLGVESVDGKRKFNVIPLTPCQDKYTRMSVEAGAVESSRVWLPEYADWLPDLELSFSQFPHGINDPVDALSQFLRWYRDRSLIRESPINVAGGGRSPQKFNLWG